MRQQTLASQASFEQYGRKGKRELFLDQNGAMVPWAELLALVEPHYPKLATAANQQACRSCSARTSCSSGLVFQTPEWKKPSMIRLRCGASPELIWPCRRAR